MFGKRKTRILFAIDNLTYGGIQTQAISLAKAFQKKGAKIYFLWTSKYEADFVKRELLDYDFKLIDGRFIYDRWWLKYSWRIHRYFPLIKMICYLRFYSIDYVIPYQFKLGSFFGAIHRHSGVKKTIFHIRNTVVNHEPKQNWYLKQALQSNLPIIANSNHARLKFKEIYGELYDLETYTINNGLNIRCIDSNRNWKAHFNVKSTDFVVSVIANFFKEKDFITVFRAWQHFVKQTNSNSKLIIAGDEGIEGKRDIYKNKVKELGIADSVIFLGRTAYNIELLSITDCNILSTDNEGLPNSVIETLAMAKPFIGTNVDGVREVVGEAYPIPLFEKGDYKHLRAILLKLYNDEYDLQKIRDYSLERYKLFSVDELIKNYSKIITV